MGKEAAGIAALLILASALAPGTPANSADYTASGATAGLAETCFGQAPTIVGTPGQEFLLGTDGPDVIVTNGAVQVDAVGGDDLVCVTGRAVPYGGANISLGPGADQLLGDPSKGEIVFAGDEVPGEVDRDIVHTGGGSDVVVTGGEESGAGGTEDQVGLGDGRDWLRVEGPVSTAATFVGGRGRDGILLWADRPRGVAVTIDNRREELLLGGEVAMEWNGFQVFESSIIEGPFTFRGTGLSETVGDGNATLVVGDRWKVDVRMGGGRDRVVIEGGARGSRIDGGSGGDRLKIDSWDFRIRNGGFIYGRDGNDHLVGGNGRDTLIGGRGHDVADGRAGDDRCRAEVLTRCET